MWCDEIWTPSQFVADALTASLGIAATALRVVPHAVDRDPMPPLDMNRRETARRAIGIPPDTFVAGTSWSMLSNFERKGVRFAIMAFQLAFPPRPASSEVLLLRCRDMASFPAGASFIHDAAARDPRIVLLDDTTLLDIVDFYHAVNVYLSLSRGEGYGLPIAEAAQIGLPVLATGWGLAADLSARPTVSAVGYRLVPVDDPQRTYDGIQGVLWAEPDIHDTARRLRSLHGAD
jgi:glycosyltransferase involved in cell wall biosynthesis